MQGMSTSTPLLVFAGSTRAQSWNRRLAGDARKRNRLLAAIYKGG